VEEDKQSKALSERKAKAVLEWKRINKQRFILRSGWSFVRRRELYSS